MLGNSRKKLKENLKKLGELDALPTFDTSKLEKDEFIIKDLGVNKDKKNVLSGIADKINLKKSYFILPVVLIMIIVFAVFKFVSFNVSEMVWRTSVTKGSENINNKSIEYSSFNNGLMRISNDGITYIDTDGEIRWTISYNMKDPIYVSRRKYFCIADRNGYDFCIFDENGESGRNTVTYPIEKIAMSDEGVVYILQSDENSSYINVYRHNGNIIDISIKSTLTGDGMPIDISTSDDGTELVVAYTCLSSNDVYTKATYYNFAEAGQNANSKRIVKEIANELKDKFLARVHFFDNKRSCLIYDGGVNFVSTSNLSNPDIFSRHSFEDKIKSIAYNDKYLAMVLSENKLVLFNKDGNKIVDKKIDFDYENLYLSDDYIIFVYGNIVKIYNASGKKIFDKEMNSEIQYVAKKKSLLFAELLVGIVDGVECIKFY